MREYGHRNIIPFEEDYSLIIKYYDVDVKVDVGFGVIAVIVYMKGECDYTHFPIDGSDHTLDDLARYTMIAPGAYINSNGTYYCPNYSITFTEADIDHGDFMVRAIDRLVSQSGFNSDFFADSLAGMFDVDSPDMDHNGCRAGNQSSGV